MDQHEIKEVYFEENPKLKYSLFLLNAFLVIGLVFVPMPNLPLFDKIPEWLSHINDTLGIALSIPLVYRLPHLFKKRGLRVSEAGLSENLSTFRENHFPWTQMIRIRFARILFMKYLLIDIPEPKSYIRSQHWIRQWTMNSDLKHLGTPVKIPIYTLKKKPHEVLLAIQEVHQILVDRIRETTHESGEQPL